jgi:hypothetical protein
MDSWSFGMVLIQLYCGHSMWESLGESEGRRYDDSAVRERLYSLTQSQVDAFLAQRFGGSGSGSGIAGGTSEAMIEITETTPDAQVYNVISYYLHTSIIQVCIIW